MNEQLLQMLYQWQQQQNQPFNINTNSTLPNSQMQPFTQQVWQAPQQSQWNNSFPNGDFSYSTEQQDPLQNSMSQIPENAGMYSDSQTGQVVNFDPNLFINNQSNNNSSLSYLNSLSKAFAPVSTETSTFKLGQSLAFNNNNPYATQRSKNANTVRGIAAGGATLASLLRTGLQGAAYQNVQNDFATNYFNRQNQQDYAYMENGGEVSQEQFLTGSYLSDNMSQGIPTAEVEGGEYVQSPQGNVQQVIGDSHNQGGVDLALEQGSKVISDNLKLGGKNAREIKRQFGIEVKASHTFADAIDKYKNKIGLSKLDKEQEGLFKKLEDKTGIDDQQTNAINEQYLATQIQETELAKNPLNQQLVSFTDELFQKQEELKGNSTELQFENGGTYTGNQLKDLAKKHNLTEEQASEIITSLKEYADGGIIPSQYGLSQYGNQPQTTQGLYGNINSANYGDRVAEIQNLHPEIYAQIFDANGQLQEGKTWADYQRAVNANYANILGNYAQLYGENSPEYQNLSSQVRNQMFVEGDAIKGYDSKAGNFTLSRPNFSVDIIPQDELQRLRQQGIQTSSQLRAQNPDLYKKYVETNNLKGDFYLGAIPTTNTQQSPNTQTENNSQVIIPKTQGNQFAGLDLIDQTLPPPSPLQGNRMPDAQYRNYEATLLGYEPQVQALYNQETAAVNQLSGLSPAQRAAALTQISASVQDNVGQVIGQTNAQNQQELARTANMNTQLFNQYGLQDSQERDLYEQRTYQALSAQENNLNNYYQYNNQLNALNAQQNNQARTLANLFQNVTLDSNGQVVLNGVSPILQVPTIGDKFKQKTNTKNERR